MGPKDDRRRILIGVRRRRKELGWSQDELAKRAHTSRETIIRIEKGDLTVKQSTLDDVLHASSVAEATQPHTHNAPGDRVDTTTGGLDAELERVRREYAALRGDVYRAGEAIFDIIDKYNLEPPALPFPRKRHSR